MDVTRERDGQVAPIRLGHLNEIPGRHLWPEQQQHSRSRSMPPPFLGPSSKVLFGWDTFLFHPAAVLRVAYLSLFLVSDSLFTAPILHHLFKKKTSSKVSDYYFKNEKQSGWRHFCLNYHIRHCRTRNKCFQWATSKQVVSYYHDKHI